MTAIRPATIDDLPDVDAIVQSAYAPWVPRIGRKPAPMLDDYAALIARGHVHVLDAEPGIEGIIVLIPEPETMLLDNVAVRSGRQGLGYGRQLLAFAEHFARASGYRSVRLYTNALMTENIALYTRLGFRETHRGEEHGLHRVYMTRDLGA
jgi:GNAT superfamily N-acetyltransferase